MIFFKLEFSSQNTILFPENLFCTLSFFCGELATAQPYSCRYSRWKMDRPTNVWYFIEIETITEKIRKLRNNGAGGGRANAEVMWDHTHTHSM